MFFFFKFLPLSVQFISPRLLTFLLRVIYFMIFRHVRKIAKGDYLLRHVCCPSVGPSVRPYAWNNLAHSERIFIKFDN